MAIDYLLISTVIFLAIMVILLVGGKKRQLYLSVTQQSILIGCGLVMVWFFPYLINRFPVLYVFMFYFLIFLGVAWVLSENRLKEAEEQAAIGEQPEVLSAFDLTAEVAAAKEASGCLDKEREVLVAIGEETAAGAGDKTEITTPLMEKISEAEKPFREPEGNDVFPANTDYHVSDAKDIYDDEQGDIVNEAEETETDGEDLINLEQGPAQNPPVMQDDSKNNKWDDVEAEIRHNINKNEAKNEAELSADENNGEGILLQSSEERCCEREEEEEAALLNVDVLLEKGFDAKSAGDLSHAITCFFKALELSEEPELRFLLVDDIVHMCLETGNYRAAIEALGAIIDKGVAEKERLDNFYRQMRRLEFIEEELAAREMAGLPYRQVPRLIRLRVEEKLDRLDIAKQGEGSSTWI